MDMQIILACFDTGVMIKENRRFMGISRNGTFFSTCGKNLTGREGGPLTNIDAEPVNRCRRKDRRRMNFLSLSTDPSTWMAVVGCAEAAAAVALTVMTVRSREPSDHPLLYPGASSGRAATAACFRCAGGYGGDHAACFQGRICLRMAGRGEQNRVDRRTGERDAFYRCGHGNGRLGGGRESNRHRCIRKPYGTEMGVSARKCRDNRL